jgi:hypothetical protein
MKTLIKIALAAVVITTTSAVITFAAKADATTSCKTVPGYQHERVCTTMTIPEAVPPKPFASLPKSEQLEILQDNAEREARIAKWEAFCKPQFSPDRYGVRRASYAHDGCDLGRDQ